MDDTQPINDPIQHNEAEEKRTSTRRIISYIWMLIMPSVVPTMVFAALGLLQRMMPQENNASYHPAIAALLLALVFGLFCAIGLAIMFRKALPAFLYSLGTAIILLLLLVTKRSTDAMEVLDMFDLPIKGLGIICVALVVSCFLPSEHRLALRYCAVGVMYLLISMVFGGLHNLV